jgi:hypothetical protein
VIYTVRAVRLNQRREAAPDAFYNGLHKTALGSSPSPRKVVLSLFWPSSVSTSLYSTHADLGIVKYNRFGAMLWTELFL